MITVKFYGHLKKFGTDFKLEVSNTAEAIRALCTQIGGLREILREGMYKIRIGRQYLDNTALEKGLFYCLKKGQTIHFTPVIQGAKNAGVFNIVVGAILVAASWYAGGAAGWSYLGASAYGTATMGTMLGASMILSGVSQLLTKTPSLQSGAGSESEKSRSTAFSNLDNLVAQGRPVPLAYGLIRTGSLVISQGRESITIKENQSENNKSGFKKG